MKITKVKTCKFASEKVSFRTPTDAELAKINTFTKRPFKADELRVGQMRLAHNVIDRDNERFSEYTLQCFADTAIRKTVCCNHDRDIKNAVGKFFDVAIEKMPVEQARQEMGEDLRLPSGLTEVHFLAPWFYIPVGGLEEKDLIKIEAGIFDYVSIGFCAEKCVSITDGLGNTLYYEYQGKGETREGSFVYLGAQPGAAMKSADEDKHIIQTGGTTNMDKILEALRGFGIKIASVDTIVADIKAAFDALTAKVKELTDKVADLAPLAEDGRAYRKMLVDGVMRFGTLLGEIPADEAGQKTEAEFYQGLAIARLRSIHDKWETAARQKFPQEFTFKVAEDGRDKSAETTGTSAAESPLVADAKKRAETAQKK